MKKHLFITLIFCLLSLIGFSQIKFFKVFTNNGYDYGQGIAQLADSSYMITGSSSSFEEESSQVFLMKLDSMGVYQWSKNYGGTESDWGRRVLNWKDSIFFITGYSISPVTGFYNNYLIKCDKDGNQILDKYYNHSGWDKVNDALITSDSTIYMVGETTATPNNNKNFYIVKTDHNGDTLWTRNFGSSGEDLLRSIKQFDDTTFYAVGEIYNADSMLVKGAIIKFYDDGTTDWVKEFGLDGEYGLDDFFIRGGNLYSVGSRTHPLGDLDEYRLTTTMEGIFIEEFSGHTLGNVFYEQVTQYGTNGKVYIAGYRQDEFSTGGSVDVTITRFYDNLVWNNLYVDISFLEEDRNCQIIPTNDGGAIAVGYITVQGYGGSSVYALKIGPNDDFPEVNLNSVESLVEIQQILSNPNHTIGLYPNPSAEKFQILSSLNEPVEMEIFNLFGIQIWDGDVVNGTEIPTYNWSKGIYLVKFVSKGSENKIIRLIVQ